MANVTKTCNLTENEFEALINYHADNIRLDMEGHLERMNYLNKRLKAFNQPETETETETKPTPAVAGWGTPTT